MVVYINVPQQQKIPVQFCEVLHTYKYFFLTLKVFNNFFDIFFFDFYNFLDFLKTLLLDLTLKKQAKMAEENT